MALMGDDWFVLTCLSLSMIALWFGARSISQRVRNQIAVFASAWGVGITSLWFHLFTIFNLLHRPRPYDQLPNVHMLCYMRVDPSFPAESAAIGFAFATAIWIGNRKAGIALYILAFLWAFGRVYCGVHYPADVFVGALIGVFTSYGMFKLYQILKIAPLSFIKLLKWLNLA